MTDLEKTQAYLNMSKKERQALLVNEWYLENYITIIEKQTLEFMNQHTCVVIVTDVMIKSEDVKYVRLTAVDPATFKKVFEKTITKGR